MKLCNGCNSENPSFLFRSYSDKDCKDLFLCENCVRKITSSSNPLGSVNGEIVFESLGLAVTPEQMKVLASTKCENCGTTQHDVSRFGMFGCPECYAVFSDLLGMADAQIEHEIQVKKKIRDSFTDSVPGGTAEVLKRKMQDAIREEQYELAASLRDQIKGLTEEDSDK